LAEDSCEQGQDREHDHNCVEVSKVLVPIPERLHNSICVLLEVSASESVCVQNLILIDELNDLFLDDLGGPL